MKLIKPNRLKCLWLKKLLSLKLDFEKAFLNPIVGDNVELLVAFAPEIVFIIND